MLASSASLFLLVLTILAAAPTTILAPTDQQVEQLRQLRRIVLDGLELRRNNAEAVEASRRRSGGSGGGASLKDVYRGARAFAAGVTAATNGTAAAASPIAAWFHNLFRHMLAILPLAVWITFLAAFILLLVGLLILIISCCINRSGRADRIRNKAEPHPLLYNDIDIVGKKQPPYGTINFALEYDVPRCTLIIVVSSCIGLPKDLKEDLDPYVVVRVSPDTAGKKHHHHHHHHHGSEPDRSKVVKNSVHPSFNYTKHVKIRDKREVKRKIITFEVYDWDIGTRHRMIARRVLNLSKLGENLDDILGRKVEFSRDLQPGVNEEATGPGDICLALCYSPHDKHLWVHIIECKGVFLQKSDRPDLETMPNTYVKLTLTMAGSAKRISKTTNTIKESRNPYFNEQFVFKMEPIQMQVASLRIVLMHRTDTLRIKSTLGVMTMSLLSEKDSIALLHWRETVLHHGRPMARWHSLITLEEEQKQAALEAAAELKKQLELAEEQQTPAAMATPAAAASATSTGR